MSRGLLLLLLLLLLLVMIGAKMGDLSAENQFGGMNGKKG